MLKQAAKPSEKNCQTVVNRICDEVLRIVAESQRIQSSGDIRSWTFKLAHYRASQCIRYHRLGDQRARHELDSTLGALVYRYIAVPGTQISYQARLSLIEDFLKNFYHEAMNVFRQENQLAADYRPRRGLELSECMAFTEFYGKRRIFLERGRSQVLIVLRAQALAKQQTRLLDENADQANESVTGNKQQKKYASLQRLRENIVFGSEDTPLRKQIVNELMAYLQENEEGGVADYFRLRLMDLPANEIEQRLGLTSQERDSLQQRFKSHLLKFTSIYHWELVHEWLGAELKNNFGLTSQ